MFPVQGLSIHYVNYEKWAIIPHNFFFILGIILSIAPIIVFLAEVSFRTIHIYEERKHLYTRYENNIKNLLADIYYFPNHIIIGTISAIALFAIYQKNTIENPINPLQLWYNMGLWSLIFSFFGFFFLYQGLNLVSFFYIVFRYFMALQCL